jgi:hypothetical protein
MGKNFAMMEMRIILSHLFRNFSFALAEPVLKRDPASFLGINRGTMGPQVCSTMRSTTTALHTDVSNNNTDFTFLP